MRNIDAGDLTERVNLRNQLNCKSYRWFLEHIYPENRQWHKFISIGPVRLFRQLREIAYEFRVICLFCVVDEKYGYQ